MIFAVLFADIERHQFEFERLVGGTSWSRKHKAGADQTGGRNQASVMHCSLLLFAQPGYIQDYKEPEHASEKRTYVLIDPVRIAVGGSDATIDHADANLSSARIAIGAGIAAMTDADIVEMYNDILASQWATLETWDKTVVEEPPGEKQIDYHEKAINGSREATCSDASSTTVDRVGNSSSISTTKSCRSRISAACSASRSDGEMTAQGLYRSRGTTLSRHRSRGWLNPGGGRATHDKDHVAKSAGDAEAVSRKACVPQGQ
jgi:hypothetical protein